MKSSELKKVPQDLRAILRNYHGNGCYPSSFDGQACFQDIIEEICPQEQLCFPMITGDYYYSNRFRFCPECMKQGYHTMLSQLPSEERCPIHDIEYIVDEDFNVDWNPKSVDKYAEIIGVPFPLPFKRNELDYSLVGKRLQELFNGVKNMAFITASTDFTLPNQKAMEQKAFVRSIAPDFDMEQYAESVWDYYIDSLHKVRDRVEQLPEKTRYISGRNEIAKEKFDGMYRHEYIGDVMTLACLYDYISDVDIDDYPYDYPDMIRFLSKSVFPSENISAAKASFCYAVRGCCNLFDIFSPMYIYSEGSATNYYYFTGACSIRNYDYKFEKYLSDFWKYPDHVKEWNRYRKISFIISAICREDHIKYLGQKYLEHISAKPEFDFYTEWESIRPIMYEIDENPDGRIDIYRIQL